MALAALAADRSAPDDGPPRGLGWLVRLGRGSLLAYALHVPLCYGRLASPLAGKLSMATATPLMIGLAGLVLLCLMLRDAIRQTRRQARRRDPSSVATR